jgi:hypothetical protein
MPRSQEEITIHRQALKGLVESGVMWRALNAQREDIESSAESTLRQSMEMNEIIHARGVLLGLSNLFANIERAAKKEIKNE